MRGGDRRERAVMWVLASLLLLAVGLRVGGAAFAPSAVWVLCAAAIAHFVATGRGAPAGPQERLGLLAAATTAHLVLLISPPWLSDDVWRYALDGATSVSGLHPLAYAPSSPKLDGIGDAVRAHVNHPELRSIYPPLAQLVFALTQIPHPGSIWPLRVAATAALALACLAARPLSDNGSRLDAGLTLWSHPLGLACVSGGGHLDAWGVLLGVLFVRAASGGHVRGVFAAAGAAIALKWHPALWLGAALGRPTGWARWAAVSVAAVAASWIPLLGPGPKAVGSLGTYAATWSFNGSLAPVAGAAAAAAFRAIAGEQTVELPAATAARAALGLTRVYDGVPTSAFFVDAALVGAGAARLASIAVMAFAIAFLWRRRSPPVSAALGILVALIVASPVVHPWYLLWALPLAVATGSRTALLLCATTCVALLPAAWEVAGRGWATPAWIAVGVYVPPVVRIALGALRGGSEPLTSRRATP